MFSSYVCTLNLRFNLYHCVDTSLGALLSPRVYHKPSSQCFDTDMVY